MSTEQLTLVFLLLVIYQFKHFLADFPLQTEYMLRKFRRTDWVLPLSAHAGTHAISTLFIVAIFTQNILLAVGLAIFDFIIHFIMDRIKASPDLLGRWGPSESKFWYMVGIDQMVHHLTHYTIIYFIITSL